MDKKQLNDELDSIFTNLKNELLYFHDKDPEYAKAMMDWFKEVSTKNKIIHTSKEENRDKEMARRRRSKVYYIDFGVNVGSEFNYPHFGVVIAEHTYTAVVIPLSSKKDKDENNWKQDERSPVIEIGEVSGFPYESKECYALIGQIKTISKQRLSDYRTEDKEFVKLSLSSDQMDIIGVQPTKREMLARPL